ncbi:hypothetical protein QTI33_09320 [Variovorax sp. J22P271]|nr:hypothetical protein [Variovorax sp. J22P271]
MADCSLSHRPYHNAIVRNSNPTVSCRISISPRYADARMAWRFLDLTGHVEYTAVLLARTIQQEMHAQASFCPSLGQARAAVKEIIGGKLPKQCPAPEDGRRLIDGCEVALPWS